MTWLCFSREEFGGEEWHEMEKAGWTYKPVASLLAGDGYVISPWLNKTLENGCKTTTLKQQAEGKANGFWM